MSSDDITEQRTRRPRYRLKYQIVLFALLNLSIYVASSFASTINNSALISFKIGNSKKEISTNSSVITIITPTGAAVLAPENNAIVPKDFTILGTASHNTQIEIKIDGVTQYTLTSDPNGFYAQEIVFPTAGTHTIEVLQNGVLGETVTLTASPSLPLNYPMIKSPQEGERIDSRRPQIIGKAAPNHSVIVYAKASPVRIVGVGTSNSNGDVTIDLNQDLTSGETQLFMMDTTSNVISETHEVTLIDPSGVIFDSITNNPISGAQVTLFNASTNNPATPGVEIATTDVNPVTTGADGQYMFNAVNGIYYLRVTAIGYTFPSTLSSFPRTVTTGSKGEQFTIARAALTINLPADAQNNLLKIKKDANKKEVVVGDIVTYTVTIINEKANDLNNVFLDDKIPPGFKYITGKVILDNVRIADPTGNRPLTFNIGTVSANTTRTLKYQLAVSSAVTFGNYENSCLAKYANEARISNIATKTVKVVPDSLFDLGTVIGKVFYDQNENGIQDKGEETLPYVRIVTEEGTIITTDKEGRWHLPGVTPGRHLFRIDESTLPEGSSITTEKVVIVDITPGLLSKVNFGVKIPIDRLKELKETKGIDLQIVQEKSLPHLRLNVAIYPDKLKIKDQALVDQPVFKIFTNYHLFIKKWKLEIFEGGTKKIFKKFEGGHLNYEDSFHWDGRSDSAELVKSGKSYFYILTVWDERGKFDVTKEREFRVEEFHSEEEFKKSVIDSSEKEKEFKEWAKQESQLNNLDKQTMSVRGEALRIKTQGQKGKLQFMPVIDGKMPTSLSYEDEIDTDIILPEGVHHFKLQQSSEEGTSESIYEKQINVGEDYFFFVVLGDAETGYNFHKGNIEPVQANDKFQEGFWKQGRLAYYLKGKIKGKYLITSSLDTERKRKEIFKVVDPKKYYPVYGDASSINYEASDTQGQLYCLIEWDKSKAIWGNYTSDFNDVEFAKFNRTLYGGKISYESVSSTKFGEPHTKAVIFDATVQQRAAHNEFVGTGGSLFYFKHRDIIEGTDAVKIEVRDKISGLVLATIEQKRGVDYHIDYSQGRILFWRPVSSIAESNSIISTYLLAGNPVYVVVDYEFETKDKYYQETQGIRVSQSITDYLQLGTTYVREEKLAENYELKGIDTTVRLDKDTFVKLEYAESESEQLNNFISTDGGLSFTEIATGSGASGKAYGLKGQTKFLDKAYLNAYYSHVGQGFSNTDSISQQGTEKYGFGLNWNITSRTVFNLKQDIQRLIDSGNIQTQSQIGAQETKTTTAQIVHTPNKKLTLTGEYRRQEVRAPLSNIIAQTNRDADIIAAKGSYKVNKRVETSLEQQATVSGDKNRQTTVGIIYKAVDWLKLKLAETVGNKGTATTLGAQAESPNKKTEVFVDATVGSKFTPANIATTSAGIKSQLNEKRDIFGTYTIYDTALEGRKYVTSFGGAQKLNDKMKLTSSRDFTMAKNSFASTQVLGLSNEINDKLSADVAFEKGKVHNLDGSQMDRLAGSVNLRYLEKDNLKASSKIELRNDNGDQNKYQYLFYNLFEYIVNKDTTLFTNINLSKARNTKDRMTDAKFNELTLGAALRPIGWERLNLIGKYTYFENKQPQGQNAFTNIVAEKASVFALEGIYDLTKKIQLAQKVAFKWGDEKVSGFDFTKSQVLLWINRVNYKIDQYWGLSAEYRILNQYRTHDRSQGVLLELNRKFGDSLQVGVGYNFTNFSDDLIHSNDFSIHGPYIKITTNFFDRSPEEVAAINEKKKKRKEQLEQRRQMKKSLRLLRKEKSNIDQRHRDNRKLFNGNKGYVFINEPYEK